MEEKPALPYITTYCPKLGSQADVFSLYAYPSALNSCFQCRKPVTPNFTHQETFCLAVDHSICPVYGLPANKGFPARLRYKPPVDLGPIWQAAFTAALILALAGLVWLGWKPLARFVQAPELTRQAASSALPLFPLPAPSQTLLPSTTPVFPTATQRPSPTPTITITVTAIASATATSTQVMHVLDIPFSVGPTRFLLHRMLAGESLDGLALKYASSLEVLRKVNMYIPSPMIIGHVIVITPGLKVVDPALPAFEPYVIPDVVITLESLASRLKVDPVLLKYYTVCTDPCRFFAGEWLIIPRLR